MMVRGEVCLIVANTGRDMGLISEEYYPAIILLIIVSSILTPLFLKMLYKKFPHIEVPEMAEGMDQAGQLMADDSENVKCVCVPVEENKAESNNQEVASPQETAKESSQDNTETK